MRRRRLRIALLTLPALVVSSVLMAAPSAGADSVKTTAAGRSNLEVKDGARPVRIELTGAAMLDKVNDAGFDIEHGLKRVPNGIEGEAMATADEIAELKALGVKILGDDEGFEWPEVADGGIATAFGARSVQPLTH